MTVVNPKSISGINSITMASGSDNLLTIHTTNTTERVRVNSDGDVIVGSGITVSPDGDIFATGVTTSTTFVGALTGTASGNAVLTGSTNNTVTTVTGANAIQGESNLTFDGTTFTAAGSGGISISSSGADLTMNSAGTIFTGNGGNASDPIIRNVSDQDTGVFYPAADNLAVTTGGSERLRIDSGGLLTVTTTGSDSGIRLVDSSTSSGSPNLEIISKRVDANDNTAFSSNIFLGKNRTDQKVTSGIRLGTINFGGNHTDGTEANISYSASIQGIASDDFDSKTDMPTDLIFTTGTSGTDRDGEAAGSSNVGTERLRIQSDGRFFFGGDTTNQDSNKYVFVGTKAFSGGITQGQLAVVDNNAYNTTDNGGSIGFQAKYNSGGAYTQMASCGGLKSNNTNGNYEGRFQISVRNHVGNSIEYVSIEPTSSKFRNSLTTESELNMTRDDGTPANKYFDSGHLNNSLHFRRTNGGDGGHTVQMYMFSNLVIQGDFNDTSDGKLKTNKVDIADGALSKVNQFKPVTFDWIDSTRPNDCIGFIAQDLKSVVPNLVSGTEYDETETDEKGNITSAGYSVNTIGVVAYLTKAMQELSAKNDALEARIAALEG